MKSIGISGKVKRCCPHLWRSRAGEAGERPRSRHSPQGPRQPRYVHARSRVPPGTSTSSRPRARTRARRAPGTRHGRPSATHRPSPSPGPHPSEADGAPAPEKADPWRLLADAEWVRKSPAETTADPWLSAEVSLQKPLRSWHINKNGGDAEASAATAEGAGFLEGANQRGSDRGTLTSGWAWFLRHLLRPPRFLEEPAQHLGATSTLKEAEASWLGCSRLTHWPLSSWATLSLSSSKPVLSVGRKLLTFSHTLWPVI